MKRRKLLARLNRFLAQSDDEIASQRLAMHKVLAALKVKEKRLQKKVVDIDDPQERARLLRELAVCRAQREKGVERLRALRGKTVS